MKSIKIFTIVLLIVSALVAEDNQSLKDACAENNATACYEFGLPMIKGENAKSQDIREEGLAYMRKACMLNETRGCDEMGDNYYRDANYAAAHPFLVKSCDRGIKSACEAVGTIFRDGHHLNQDDVKSREFYLKACDLKSGDACYNIAMMYRGGFGVDKNRTQEKYFYQRACDAGLNAGCTIFTDLDNEDKGIETGVWASIKAWFN
jgi:TPR repeat protein